MKRTQTYRYLQLASELREQIMKGELQPGQLLKPEHELSKIYKMSRTSVRKSLEVLVQEGLITKKAGHGSEVCHWNKSTDSDHKALHVAVVTPSHYVNHCLSHLIEQYQTIHPHIKIKVSHYPSTHFWNLYTSNKELGYQADLLLITDQHYQMIHQHGPFTNLLTYLDKPAEAMYPFLKKSFIVNEQLFAIPVTFSTVYLVYNPNLLQKLSIELPQSDWNKYDFLRTAQKATIDMNQDGISDVYGFHLSHELNRWPVVALQNGVFFDEKDANEAWFTTFNWFHDLLYRYRVSPPLATRRLMTSQPSQHPFVQQKVAMMLTTAIEMAAIKDLLTFTPKIAPLPFGQYSRSMLIANLLLIPEDANMREEAFSFLNFILNEKTQTQLTEQTQFLSIFPEVNEALWDPQDLANLNILMKDDIQLVQAYLLHEVIHRKDVLEFLQREMTSYWSGMESAKQLTDRFMKVLHSP